MGEEEDRRLTEEARRTVGSDGSRRSSLGSTDGVLKVSKVTIEDTGEDMHGAPLEDNTLSGLFLSGRFTSFASPDAHLTSLEGDDEMDIALQYFPDPPCVLPPDEEEDPDDHECGRPNVVDYWKDHCSSFETWPKVKQMRDLHEQFIQTVGSGHMRTSSVMNNKLFVNISAGQLGVRASATLSETQKTGQVIESGQLVAVREMEDQEGVRFWKLREMTGYMFETKEGVRLMQEAMNVETGKWWYRVASSTCLEIRKAPGYGNELRTGWVLSPGELVVVVLRCRIGSSSFLLLRDGRGWVFAWKPSLSDTGHLRASHDAAMEECNTDFLEMGGNTQDFRKAIPPTDQVVEVGSWTYVVQKRPVLCVGTKQHGTFLNAGDIIKIDKRVTASGAVHRSETMQERVWLRLLDGRGWVPIHSDDGFEAMVEQDPNDLTYPSWFGGNKNIDTPKEAWMVGFA